MHDATFLPYFGLVDICWSFAIFLRSSEIMAMFPAAMIKACRWVVGLVKASVQGGARLRYRTWLQGLVELNSWLFGQDRFSARQVMFNILGERHRMPPF